MSNVLNLADQILWTI